MSLIEKWQQDYEDRLLKQALRLAKQATIIKLYEEALNEIIAMEKHDIEIGYSNPAQETLDKAKELMK